MFEHLSRYGRVVVTGPQRSGTTICARMIAQDTGLEYIDEQRFQATEVDRWRAVMRLESGFVMQAPGMCRYVHEFGDNDDVAIVLVRRDIEDIEKSQQRVGWNWEAFELERYGKGPQSGPIAQVKYDYWDRHQRGEIANAFEVDYEDLSSHPLWLPKELRADFHSRQWHL